MNHAFHDTAGLSRSSRAYSWLCWAAPPVISILSLLFFERPGPGNAGDRAQALVSVDLALLAAAAVLGAAIILGVNARQAASHRMQRAEGNDAGL